MPRVKFCWECGRKLRGSSHVLALVGGHVVTLHEICAQEQGIEYTKRKADKA